MKALLLAAVALTAMHTSARADFFTYSEWQRLAPASRAAYIAGAFDAYENFAITYISAAQHFANCLMVQKINNSQIADNIIAFAQVRPELQGRPVPAVMIQYLVQLCGPVPPAN